MQDNFTDKNNKILLAHGSGGKLMHRLIEDLFKDKFKNLILDELSDSAVIRNSDLQKNHLCFTTDSYVVKPLFFPGADIGKVSICGTINDLAVSGAKPLYISCGFIIEEGLDYEVLERIVSSMANVTEQEGIKIVTGDIKVVSKGEADRIFINTSGIGIKDKKLDLSKNKIEPSDKILINGPVAAHGLAVLSAREQFNFKSKVRSDCAALSGLIAKILNTSKNIRFMRDPTRGGLATTLNEIVQGMNFGVELEEANIPVSRECLSMCELLGFDPLYIANEGKVVVIVKAKDAKKILNTMRRHPQGENSRIIGETTKEHKGKVILKTRVKGRRIVDMLTADQLPRIC